MSDNDNADDKPAKKPRARTVEIVSPPLLLPAVDRDGEDDTTDDERAARKASVPLLDGFGARGAKPDHLAVYRVDPAHGFLGTAPLDADERYLATKYGGRTLKIEARTAEGAKINVKGSSRLLEIAADPVLPSTPLGKAIAGATSAQEGALDRFEILRNSAEERIALMKAEIESKRAREADERRAELERSKLEHAQQLELLRARSREDQERAQASATQMIALIQASATAQVQVIQKSSEQQMQWMQQMLQASQNRPERDPIEILRVGMELARDAGGGADPAQTSFAQLVDLTKHGLQTLGGRAAPKLPPPRGARVNPTAGAGDASAGDDKRARVRSKLGSAIQQLQGAGYDVEEVLDGLLAQLPSGAQPAAAPAQPALPAAAPAQPTQAATRAPSLDDFAGDDE